MSEQHPRVTHLSTLSGQPPNKPDLHNVLIVVVTYNAQEWISTFLGKSEGIDERQFLVVDNGSTDQTISEIKGSYPGVRIFEAKANLGFGGGNNLGFKYAIEQGYDYVFLLNQDAYITSAALNQLLAVQQNTQAGIVSPMQYYRAGVLDRKFEMYLRRGGADLDALPAVDHLRIDFVNAALWLLPVDVIRKVGGFDPLFHHYGEDNDYVNRVRYHGYELVVATHVEGFHVRSQHPTERVDDQLLRDARRRCLIAAKDINVSATDAAIKFLRTGGSQFRRYFPQKGIPFMLQLLGSQLRVAGMIAKISKHRRLSKRAGGGKEFFMH